MRKMVLAAMLLLFPLPALAASVDGARIHFTTYGTEPKTVVFVHGWTCDETSSSSQVPVLMRIIASSPSTCLDAARVNSSKTRRSAWTRSPAPAMLAIDIQAL